MSDNTKIEWTDATWNPVRGCSKISPGRTHDAFPVALPPRFREPVAGISPSHDLAGARV